MTVRPMAFIPQKNNKMGPHRLHFTNKMCYTVHF